MRGREKTIAHARSRGFWCLLALALPAEATAAPEPERSAVGPPEEPIFVNEDGRSRVRGDRPDGASIHLAYAKPDRRPDAAMRAVLRDFEDRVLPPTLPRAAKTIVDEPPEQWMRKLALPDMPVRWHQRTIDYLRWFKEDPQGRSVAQAWIRRMGRHGPRIREILREVGVPEDLVFVAMIESGFHPEAQSHVGAAGMWQFMEPTGRVYGLEVDYWQDMRLDFERSTWAAATYLSDLHTRFGSWELALAAYNAGYGLLVKSIRDNNTNNYWALVEIEGALPHQTVNYVPKFLAVAIVAKNPTAFGLEIGEPLPRLQAVDVEVAPGTELERLARALGIDEGELGELNAELVRDRVPPREKGAPARSNKVTIPRSSLAAFKNLSADQKKHFAPDPATTVLYTVRLGEDLEEIAWAHAMTEKELRRLNAVHDSGEIGAGTVLVLPRPPADLVTAAPKPPLAAVPALEVPPTHDRLFFRVTRAATQRAITAALSVTWSEIVAWNDLDPHARLVDGQILQILAPKGFDGEAAGVRLRTATEVVHVVRGTRAHLDAALAATGLLRRAYKVRQGDDLEGIARRFGTTKNSIARINGVVPQHRPAAGDVLVLHVDDAHRRGTIEAPPPRKTALTAELVEAEVKTTSEPEHRAPSTADTARVPGRNK